VNWPNLIFDLLRAGLSEARAARLCGTSRQVINALKMGDTREPRWSTGQKLIALHKSYVKEGFIDGGETAQLGAVLARGFPQTGDCIVGRVVPATTRG
jgi:hypothetical protein